MPQESETMSMDVSTDAGPQNLVQQDFTSFDDVGNEPPEPEGNTHDDKAPAPQDEVTDKIPDDVDPNADSPTPVPPKMIKAKVGDKEVDLDPNSIIRKKVDGQVKEFKLSEVLDGFSGDMAVQRRMNEANKIRQEGMKLVDQTKQERQTLIESFTRAGELAKEGKHEESMMHFAKVLGLDPIVMATTLQDAINQAVAQARDVPAEEWDMMRLKAQNDLIKNFTRTSREEDTAQRERAEKMQSAESRIRSACEQFKVSAEELDAEYKVCEIMQARGQLSKEIDLTPDFVARQANRVKLVGKVRAELPKYFPGKMNDQKFVEELISDIANNPDFSEVDWKAMAEGAKKSKDLEAAKRVSKKVNGSGTVKRIASVSGELVQTNRGTESRDIWDVDQL